jgi:hypothetical protein
VAFVGPPHVSSSDQAAFDGHEDDHPGVTPGDQPIASGRAVCQNRRPPSDVPRDAAAGIVISRDLSGSKRADPAMPTTLNDEFEFKVFISYSSKDSGWAEKLCADLEQKEIKTFLDRNRLDVGRPWQLRLRAALNSSQHLIVLWSENAQQSPWVSHEMTQFYLVRHFDRDQVTRARHRFIPIKLPGESQDLVFDEFHAITDLRRAGPCEKGVQGVDPEIWRQMIARLEQELMADKKSIAVPVIVLTTTWPRLHDLKDAEMPNIASPLNEVLAQFGVTREQLSHYYGKGRDDWCPFGIGRKEEEKKETVWNVLDRILTRINEESMGRGGLAYRWDRLDEKLFWGDDEEAIDREAKRLERGPAVIVIDPVALYTPEVRERLGRLDGCFRNPDSLIMVLAPFTLPAPCTALRQLVRKIAKQIYQFSYEPPWHNPAPFAQCSAQAIDGVEVKRLLHAALARHGGPQQLPPTVPYTRQ